MVEMTSKGICKLCNHLCTPATMGKDIPIWVCRNCGAMYHRYEGDRMDLEMFQAEFDNICDLYKIGDMAREELYNLCLRAMGEL